MTQNRMSEDIALDFTEQLMIFEKCGNVYARDEFVQAREVSHHFVFVEHQTQQVDKFLILDPWPETPDLG